MGVADVWISDVLAEDKSGPVKIEVVMNGAKQFVASAAAICSITMFSN